MKKLLINTVLFSFLTLLFISFSTMQGLGAMTAAVGAAIDSPILTAVGTSTASIARASEAITPEQEYYIGRGVAASIAAGPNGIETNRPVTIPDKIAFK